jgi:hypothetical protein
MTDFASRRKGKRQMQNAGANKKARHYQRTPAGSLTNLAVLAMPSSAGCPARNLATQRKGDRLFP